MSFIGLTGFVESDELHGAKCVRPTASDHHHQSKRLKSNKIEFAADLWMYTCALDIVLRLDWMKQQIVFIRMELSSRVPNACGYVRFDAVRHHICEIRTKENLHETIIKANKNRHTWRLEHFAYGQSCNLWVICVPFFHSVHKPSAKLYLLWLLCCRVCELHTTLFCGRMADVYSCRHRVAMALKHTHARTLSHFERVRSSVYWQKTNAREQ